MSFTIELASVPHREDLVVEVWWGDENLAELHHETDGVHLQLYNTSGARWRDFRFDDFLDIMTKARARLGDPSPKPSL